MGVALIINRTIVSYTTSLLDTHYLSYKYSDLSYKYSERFCSIIVKGVTDVYG